MTSAPVDPIPSVWIKSYEIITFELDIVNNRIRVNGHTWPFRRRWEATMMAKMLAAHEQGSKLDLATLQQALAEKGQSLPLNSTQILRLLSGIHEFLKKCPGVELHHMPRQASVGPWYLQVRRPLNWTDNNTTTATEVPGSSVLSAEPAWPYARLLDRSTLPSATRVLQVLSQALTAEAFAKYGKHQEAIEILEGWDWDLLSVEISNHFRLRQAEWLRRTGHYGQATLVASDLSATPAPSVDPQLSSYARQMLRRIAYDENPGQTWKQLLDDPQIPHVQNATCWSTKSEWHNLQALAWRRAAQSAPRKNQVAQAHQNAMLHLEAAIYGALRQQNWDRLHAYIDNLAFHLQKMQPLCLATVREVYDFYALSLTCADKLDSGADDVWDLVYFGEFWLDHAQDLHAFHEPDGLPPPKHWSLEHQPQDQGYWEDLLHRCTQTGTPRLRANALILYIRWACLQPIQGLAEQLQVQLAQLFAAHQGLLKTLRDDGYGPWLSRH